MQPVRRVDAPQPQLRAVLYLRQSVSKEESISLELQEHEGRRYAEQQGYSVVAVEADPGISGRTWKRPAVQRVMELIEQGHADVIVLWKWSRLSRSRLDWAVAADRVQTAGGRIESATEAVDTTTSTGRLARGMLTEFAAFESERIGDTWRETHARRIRNGRPANGKPRFGYTYSREDGFTPDVETGPVLAELYRRYVTGESVYALVLWLNQGSTRPVSGYGVKGDGLWSDRTLRRVLDSGFAAGYFRANGEMVQGVHPPLITAETWEAYQEARQRRRTYRRTERSEYLLSGLVRCSCGSSMVAGQFGHGRVAKYRCKAAKEKRTHTGGYITASLVEQRVYDWLVEYAAEVQAASNRAARARPRRRDIDPTIALEARHARVLAKIDRLGLQLIETDMPRDSYARLLSTLTAERDGIERDLLTHRVHQRSTPITVLPDLLTNWDRLDIAPRRELLRRLIDHVEVTPGRPVGTIEIVPR